MSYIITAMFNTEKIRKYFPLLNRLKPPVYFDSACSALKPRPVIEAVMDYYENFPACSGRSLHRLGHLVSHKIAESRKAAASFIGARSEEIVFTKNTTESVNLLAYSFPFKKNDAVLISDKEHNSNFLPWRLLSEKKKIKLLIFKTDNGKINLKKFENFVSKNKNIRLVSLSLASNLDGIFVPAGKIGKIAKKYDFFFFLDGAQALPHKKINIKNIGADFLAFSSSKLYGPTGVGFLYINNLPENPARLSSFMVGGGSINDEGSLFLGPEKFEAGLGNFAGIVAVKPALDFIEKIGWKKITEYETSLYSYAIKELEKIPGLKIINKHSEDSSPLISFYIKNQDSHSLAIRLDQKYNILLRSGYFCNNHYFISNKLPPALRFSLSFYNTKKEIDYFIFSLKKIIK